MESYVSSTAVKPAPVHRLDIGAAFEGLDSREKLYAHHMSRAAWLGARIIMQQVSPESETIFDFIIELHKVCSGDWRQLVEICKVSHEELDQFFEYAATFLSNVGNFYGSGDQKFTPSLSSETFSKLSTASKAAKKLYDQVAEPIYSVPPFSLGFASDKAQSAYYIGSPTSRDDINVISSMLERKSISPENTRIRKTLRDSGPCYEILLASIKQWSNPPTQERNFDGVTQIVGGDHSNQLTKIANELRNAMNHVANQRQREVLSQYVESFETGSLGAYRQSQKIWVADRSPRIENILGFVEPYRDPYGVRAEWEGIVAISDASETERLKKLVAVSSKFIRRLPWADGYQENDGKGPFEKSLFEPPDFTSIHALAYCSSIIFPGINLPNYNDIRQDCGFKNFIIANRMSAEGNSATLCPFVDPSEAETFQRHKFPAYYLWVVLHELLGHGTGKMLVEDPRGKFNFDIDNPPIDPLTSQPIESWYGPGDTWTGRFEDLATTVDECRAELVGAYLMDDKELLSMFGFNDDSEIRADDIVYNIYLQLGVDGLRGLQNYNAQNGTWGQAHSQAHFATLKWLLAHGQGFITIKSDQIAGSVTVQVDRTKIITHGKPALGRMLLRLHLYRCTADTVSCRHLYEHLCKVDREHLAWRELVKNQVETPIKFVQANTFLENNEVILKEYETLNVGIIDSWMERKC